MRLSDATATKRTREQNAESMRSQGVLSPLLVRPLTGQSFEIVAGARRYRAAKIGEASTVPVRIVNLTDAEGLEAQLIDLSIVGKSFLCPHSARCLAMQNFIPNRRAASAEKKSPPAPANPAQTYEAAWLREAKAKANDPQQSLASAQREDGPGVPAPEVAPGSAGEAPTPDPGPSHSTFANPSSPAEVPQPPSYAPGLSWVPDSREPFSLERNPFARYR
jgi:hypothetical protein